jgi:hypothetical protein
MSSLDNIDARIGRKPSTTQKLHATSEIYGASNKYYATVLQTSMPNLHESPHCLIFHK